MLSERCSAKNRMSNRSGYSPLQRVFGMGHRLPGELCSDDPYTRHAVDELLHLDAFMEESRRIREAAARAHVATSFHDRIQEASRARHRTSVEYRSDDVVMVWKRSPLGKRGRWVGPGVVISVHHSSVWVNMPGQLWTCSAEQRRKATSHEARGVRF
jgi:hypothetical protein